MVLNDSVMEAASWFDDPAERADFISACCDYVWSGTEPEGKSPMVMSNFASQRHSLANTRAKMLAGAAKRERNGSEAKSNANQSEIESRTNANQNGIERESKRRSFNKDKDKKNKRERDAGARVAGGGEYDPTSEGFVAPSVERVRAEAQLRGCGGIDARAFLDHYTAQGWVRGNGQPVRDWRALLTSWRCGDAERAARRDGPGGRREVSGRDFSRFDDPDAPVIDARALAGAGA